MKILNTPIKYSSGINMQRHTNPAFTGSYPVQKLTHANIGMMDSGFIGKVGVIKADGQEALLNVIKYKGASGDETYFLRDFMNRTIGEIDFKIKKHYDYDRVNFREDPSHIYVEYLRNYSNPRTPYYQQGLEEYKHVGTRLLQIAQRRSDECQCNGNIELVAKNQQDVLEFYEKLGFAHLNNAFHESNKYYLYLPPMSKEPLSKMYGGL